jgi:hypothetical protein
VGNQPPRTKAHLTCPTSHAAPADQSNHHHNPSLSGPIDEKTYRPVEPVRNHVDDPIGEMGVDPDVRMLCQKRCEGRGDPLPPKGHG